MGMTEFMKMLLEAKADFKVRWCPGEEEPCWSVVVIGEDGTSAEFCFAGKGRHIVTILVGGY